MRAAVGALVAGGVVVLTACSGDAVRVDPAEQVRTYIGRVGAHYGYELDPACVSRLVDSLSSDDLIIMAAVSGDQSPSPTFPDLSPAGTDVVAQLAGCQRVVHNTNQPLLDRALTEARRDLDGAVLDESCARGVLGQFSDESLRRLADLASGTTDPRLSPITDALFPCLSVAPGDGPDSSNPPPAVLRTTGVSEP